MDPIHVLFCGTQFFMTLSTPVVRLPCAPTLALSAIMWGVLNIANTLTPIPFDASQSLLDHLKPATAFLKPPNTFSTLSPKPYNATNRKPEPLAFKTHSLA